MPAPLLPAAVAIATEFGPGLIRWLTGSDKAGDIAEQVVDAAKSVTGASDADGALSKLRADPQLVAQFQIRVREIEADLDKAYLADRQVVCICVLVYVPDLPGEVRGIISTIAGFFGLGLRDAHQFEFGSSRGSEMKTDLLSKAQPVR